MPSDALLCVVLIIAPAIGLAQLPEGPGRAETQKLCSGCHEIERAVSLRQNRDGWKTTINRMVNFGAEGSEEDFGTVLEYLALHYPASELPPLDVNTAKAIDFESRLSLRRSQAAAIIDYRKKHGKIASLEELEKIPGVDSAKIKAKKGVLVF